VRCSWVPPHLAAKIAHDHEDGSCSRCGVSDTAAHARRLNLDPDGFAVGFDRGGDAAVYSPLFYKMAQTRVIVSVQVCCGTGVTTGHSSVHTQERDGPRLMHVNVRKREDRNTESLASCTWRNISCHDPTASQSFSPWRGLMETSRHVRAFSTQMLRSHLIARPAVRTEWSAILGCQGTACRHHTLELECGLWTAGPESDLTVHTHADAPCSASAR
jgi:hypothetical protein